MSRVVIRLRLVRVAVAATGGEVIGGQRIAVAGVKADRCPGATSVSSLTYGAQDAAPCAGVHDSVGRERGGRALDIEGEAEARDLPEASVGHDGSEETAVSR